MSEPSADPATIRYDSIFSQLIGRVPSPGPLICCLYASSGFPPFAEPMLRKPLPPIGQPIEHDFEAIVRAAIELNPAVHDGAIMASAAGASAFVVSGWSFRLFPPNFQATKVPNKGSAYNSCHAMSAVEGVVSIYLVSKHGAWRFQRGVPQELRQGA